MLISDEQLAIQLQQGDESALETIVRRYHGPIHAYILRIGAEHHVAADIVQEVFIKVCRYISKYKNGLPFRPWIYTIAANTYKDYLKKTYVQRDMLGLEIVDDNAITMETSESILLVNDERKTILAALGRLRKIHHEVLILRYYQDLKLEEIATILQVPLGTVKSRLSTALHQLKRLLVEEDILDDDTLRR